MDQFTSSPINDNETMLSSKDIPISPYIEDENNNNNNHIGESNNNNNHIGENNDNNHIGENNNNNNKNIVSSLAQDSSWIINLFFFIIQVLFLFC